MKYSIKFVFIVFAISINIFGLNTKINLSGNWKFQTDTNDIGINEEWFKKDLNDAIYLPGSIIAQGKGFEPTLETQWTGTIYDSSWFFNPVMKKYRQPGNLKFPFWLTPISYYVGPAWYQKEVVIPESFKNKQIFLLLERPHWETTVWIDGKKVGIQNSLSTPHKYNLSKFISTGKHKITIRVDNRIKDINVGPDSHSITDHTQGNWNGIVGNIELIAKSEIYINKIKIIPVVSENLIHVKLEIVNTIKKQQLINVYAAVLGFNNTLHIQNEGMIESFKINKDTSLVQFDLNMGNKYNLWDEFNPDLYQLNIKLINNDNVIENKQLIFGMVDFSINGTQFNVNGKNVFLRGNVDCAAFPFTGYPPTNYEDWERIFIKLKEFGLNHVRFHSWCPSEAAFIAADMVGIYLQPEGPSWANHGTAIGYGKPIDKYLFDECQRIIDEYGNHPSFCMMAYGNEPGGRNQVEYLTKWVNYFKEYDSTKLYTSASIGRSWPLVPASEFIVRSEPRGLPWDERPQSMFDYSNIIEQHNKPYVAHEMGQYCVFPNFNEIKKYTGAYKALNFELFKEELEQNNMGEQANDFLMASGKLQAICYKNEIEAAFRTSGFAGFQLLGINDFPGQGSAIVGVLDAFYDEKGYINGSEFIRFCNETVVLSRIPKFVYYNDETFICNIELANYSNNNFKNDTLKWYIKNNKLIVNSGVFSVNQQVGNLYEIGKIQISLNNFNSAVKLTLFAELGEYKNMWDFWVYPKNLHVIDTSQIYICNQLDENAYKVLQKGGNVFLHAAGKVENGKDVIQYFRPVFWNTSWFKMRPPHTLGILCNSEHPSLKDFPTEYYSNLQWWEILHKQQVMNLDNFPANFKPIVQPIDTWFLNRKLGLVFEANVLNGKIIVCSSDLITNINERPAAKQLYFSLLNYMNSNDFNPEYTIDYEVVGELFEQKEREKVNFYTNDDPDELKPKVVKSEK